MRRFALALPGVSLATIILVASIMRASQPKFDFGPSRKPHVASSSNLLTPKSPIWPAKALLDKAQIAVSATNKQRARVLIGLANNRLAVSEELFKIGEIEEAVSTLTKAEKYLEAAATAERSGRKKGEYTQEVLQEILEVSLMHIEVIDRLLTLCPEQACPMVNVASNYPKRLHTETKIALRSQNAPLPLTLISE